MKNNLLTTSTEFEQLCSYGSGLFKISFIRKMPKGYWGVYSHKGKLLGKYKSKQQAIIRLHQIEFFKHKKASQNEDITYTALLRQLNKICPPHIVQEFKSVFKKTFDDALLNGKDNPEDIALRSAIEFIDNLDQHLDKNASINKFADNELGDPVSVGKYLAALIKFILRKISNENRSKSINNLRNKIYVLNEFELARKKMPASSSIGQSLVIIKHLMFGKDPTYIRQVLNSIVVNLG